jgi:hypothetical protein
MLQPKGMHIPHMQQRLNYHLILPPIWGILIIKIYRLLSFVFNFIMTSISSQQILQIWREVVTL